MARIQRICKYRREAERRQRIRKHAAIWTNGRGACASQFRGFTAQRQFSSANVG